MGSDVSVLSECQIDDTPILNHGSDYSLHHGQRIEDKSQLSVFISKEKDSSVEQLAKNLKLYRHPGILRFVNYCETPESTFLFTEKVSPLSVTLKHLSPLQVCLGIQDIAQALNFIHEYGLACHNNLCQSSVFVTPEGRWKLAGMEFVTKFDQVSQSFLEKSHVKRYGKSIPPEERSNVPFKNHSKRDVFALGVLIEEVLSSSTDLTKFGDIESFIDYAKNSLQSEKVGNRPNLSEVLDHNYFKKDFLEIVQFLTDLPIKTDAERKDFFESLTEKLFCLPEKLVASQLAPLLLSRLVLLDSTASKVFIPNILTPALGGRKDFISSASINPIFSEKIFQEDVIPVLLKIFLVRDIQIRSILLRYFSGYCHLFHKVLLEEEVLPQLLLGIKDTNDVLVAESLRALADLVPLLGASKVIGKQRLRLFRDGQPGKATLGNPSIMSSDERLKSLSQKRDERRRVLDETRRKETDLYDIREGSLTPDIPRTLSERHSPIGAESDDDLNVSATKFTEEEWDNWEEEPDEVKEKEFSPTKSSSQCPHKGAADVTKKTIMDFDISKLDIKCSGLTAIDILEAESDFFADMAPVISAAPSVEVENVLPLIQKTSKFDVQVHDEEANVEGWGDWD